MLTALDTLGNGRAGGELHNAGAEEAQERVGLGKREVPGGTPGGEDATSSGIAQVDEEGEVSIFVPVDGSGDGHHEGESGGAFLHAGAAGGWGDEEGEFFGSRTVNSINDAASGGGTNGTPEEAKFAQNEGDAGAKNLPLTSDNRLINAGFFAGAVEGLLVFGADVGVVGWGAPGAEGVGVEDFGDELVGGDVSHGLNPNCGTTPVGIFWKQLPTFSHKKG